MTTPTRILFIAWQAPESRAIYPVARLAVRDDQRRYEFCYIAGVREAMRAGFRPFARMQHIEQSYFTDDLRSFPLTSNRLMPTSRPDFQGYLARLGLTDCAEPIQILARSEGRRATDNLEFFASPEHDVETNRWLYRAFVRGVRYVPGAEEAIVGLAVGSALRIAADFDNEWDDRALLLETATQRRIGFVPGVLLDDLHAARDSAMTVDVVVDRINLPPAPVQQRVLVRLAIPVVGSFAPFSSGRFEPCASEAAPRSG